MDIQQTDIAKIDEYFPQLNNLERNALKTYYERLIYFNSKLNLIGGSTAATAARQHFADAVMGLELCLKHRPFDAPVYDFGSGNGFPGMVLAILRPDLPIHLVERDLRKAEFLKHVGAELKLSQLKVIARSIETLDKSVVNLGVTRALGSIGQVLIQVNSIYAPGGTLFHFKSDNWTSEIAKSPTALFTNWDIQAVGQYTLPESTIIRHIVASTRL